MTGIDEPLDQGELDAMTIGQPVDGGTRGAAHRLDNRRVGLAACLLLDVGGHDLGRILDPLGALHLGAAGRDHAG